MHYFHWIAGIILALAWFSRIVDAAIGMPSVADISQPEWNRNPVAASGNLACGNPRVSIIVPARNEEEDIEQALTLLLQPRAGVVLSHRGCCDRHAQCCRYFPTGVEPQSSWEISAT